MNLQRHRIDELPMDRRIAGEARGISGGPQMGALYERREVDPEAPHVKRRKGTERNDVAVPNLLGATYDSTKGRIVADKNFQGTAIGSTGWTIFGTFNVPSDTDETTRYCRVVTFGNVSLYIERSVNAGAHQVRIAAYDRLGNFIVQTARRTIDTANGNAFHFFFCHDLNTFRQNKIRLNLWYVSETPTLAPDVDALHALVPSPTLELFGENESALLPRFAPVVVNNVRIFGNDDYTTGDYNALARSTDASDAGLVWQDLLSEGGNVLSYGSPEINSYVIPTAPQLYGDEPDTIRFGGLGVIEVPFYLDFDEYYWTTTNAAARENWCFQLKLTLPKILRVSTVFELQDLVRLEVVQDGGWKFKAFWSDTGADILHSTTLTGGQSYDVFVARDGNSVYLKVDTVEVSAAAPNPIVYAYDKTLGFVIGDKVDFENSAPFGGQLSRFVLHNNESRSFQDREDAVLYYDVDSVQGDEMLDRGNRSLNGYLGVRSDTQPPYYAEGGFPGGAYVAASGGYLISNSKPDIGYTGELRKPLTKDAVVQRRGRRAFLTSNGVNYIVDDRTKSIRPLGIPRPSTKVSCTPQGVGAIDGFVRYAYRYVSIDGTVGPVFELDPCDATGGVNVYLGAETFSTPGDPAFGLSYGETEKDKLVANDAVECFMARDYDSGTNQLLHKEISFPGLTLETAFRIPDVGSTVKESVISQGVYCPPGPNRWMARNAPKQFPWIGNNSQECCFQFTFRFKPTGPQTLFTIGAESQRYTTGWVSSNTHWRLHHLVVSLQWPGTPGTNRHSVVVTRDLPSGSNHRDNDLKHWAKDVTLVNGHDYTLFLSRAGTLYGNAPGADLTLAVYDHTDDEWENFPGEPAGTVQIANENFWGSSYSGSARDQVMWGANRWQSNTLAGKTRVRRQATPSIFDFTYMDGFNNGTTLQGGPGQIMYHGRMWRKDFPLTLLANKALDRYGARTGPLASGLEIDVAFCPDSSRERINGGWDYPSDARVKYFATPGGFINANVILSDVGEKAVFLAYGFDNTITAGSPDTHAVTSSDDIPMWCAYTSRDEGSLIVGTGKVPAVAIAKKKWHDASQVQTFDEFANTIDLTQWTWLTLYFSQQPGLGASASEYQVWLERVFIDGNTGPWGELFNAGVGLYKAQNTAAGAGQYTLFTVGGVPGIESDYEIEIAETRLWDGERYTAQGGGNGTETFGPYLSTRIPPNDWDKLWHYLRFAPLDVNDMDNQATMDNVGGYSEPGGNTQVSADAVSIYQGAEVKEGGDASGSGGSDYFIPFPTPPQSSIRGIQLFRTQVVPVEENYPNGEPNPNAQTDAFKACRAAPLYYLSEIPDGTQAYFDTATDALLGAELNLTEGLIPGNPGGVFEWDNFLAIWVTDAPRIHFAASPDSWESFPSDMVLDLPLKESGTIQAATELASRDARNSRVLVLGKSWGLFLDGSPMQPRVNTLGGGVGAASSRCLVVEKGIAYAYNGTLWAITGDGACEDIGLPVLDLLPDPDNTRLSVSSSLSSLFVIDEVSGLTLRWHFARREWFVEDRYALGTTDVDGTDNWVHVSGYTSKGGTQVYGDDIASNTPQTVDVTSWDNSADYLTVASTAGILSGMRVTVAANQDARIRETHEVDYVTATRIYVKGDLALASDSSNTLDGETVSLTYTVHPGVGYWGMMLDTGQFMNSGVVKHVDIGVTDGDRWNAMSAGADFAGDPSDRSAFDAPESSPTPVSDGGGSGVSSRYGLTERQRIQRFLIWSLEQRAVGLSELELNFTVND